MSIADVFEQAAGELQHPRRSNPRLAEKLEKAIQLLEREAPEVLAEEVD